MADIFLSYKREEKRIAERLSIALEQLGFDVWWDFELLSGDRFRRVIEKVIDQCSVALVLWSELSRESEFVVDEATYARDQNKLCPARIDDCRLPLGFGGTHVEDLRNWDGEMDHPGFQALLRALEGKIGRKARLGAKARGESGEAKLAELEAFKAAQIAENASALKAFLQDYPKGVFANFVRGQLDSMRAKTSAMAGGPETPPPASPTQSFYTPPPSPDPAIQIQKTVETNSDPKKSRPWAMIGAGGAALLAIIALGVSITGRQPDSAPPPVIEEPAPRDVDAEIEAARKTALEAANAERAASEQTLREELAAKEQQVADYALREQAARDEAARQQAAREQAARDQAAREQVARDAAAKAAATPYNLDQLHPSVKSAVIEARAAESRANAAASRARDTAAQAEAAARTGSAGQAGFYAGPLSDGSTYKGSYSGGTWNGLGVYVWATGDDKKNPLRYEGEWLNGKRHGVGVNIWRDGDRRAGVFSDDANGGPGVSRYSSGTRYEGEITKNTKNGYGVIWDAQGRVSQAGIWTNGALTTSLSK